MTEVCAPTSNVLQCNWELFIIQAQKKRSATKLIRSFTVIKLNQPSRLDQTKVSILTLVKHAEAVCVRVAKDDELIMAA